MKKRYNDDFDNKILELLADGNKQIQIAKILGVSRAEISRRIKIMRERGVEIPSKQDVFDKKILELLVQGLTQEQIGKEIGRSDVFVSQKIKKMKEQGIKISKTKSEIINEKILELLNDGLNQTQIAEILNVGQTAISGRIQRMRARGVKILLQHGTIYKKEETNNSNETYNQEENQLESVQEEKTEEQEIEENDSLDYSYSYHGKTLIYTKPSALSYAGKSKLSESDAKKIIDFVESEINYGYRKRTLTTPYIIDLNGLCKALREFLLNENYCYSRGNFTARSNLGYDILQLIDYYYEWYIHGKFQNNYLRRALIFDYRKKKDGDFEVVPLDEIDANVLRYWGCFSEDIPKEKTSIADLTDLIKKHEASPIKSLCNADTQRVKDSIRAYKQRRRELLGDSRFKHVREQQECFQRAVGWITDDEEEQQKWLQMLSQDASDHLMEQKECLRRMAKGAYLELPKELKNMLIACSQSRETLLTARAFIDLLLDYEEHGR